MGAIDNTQGTSVLKAMLAIAALTGAVSPTALRLGTTAPTATANMTELTGTGYTAGGSTISWNTVTNMATTNSAAITWTNTSGGNWAIIGAEIWDAAATKLRWFYGSWNGQPVNVANNNSFQLASGGASVSLS